LFKMGKRAAEKTEEEIAAEEKAARKAAKKAKKAAAAPEAEAEAEEEDPEVAKAARKAAKKAAKAAAAAATAEEEAEEEDPEAAKAARKAAKKAAKAAAATAPAEEAEEEEPPAKKPKEDPEAKGKGKGKDGKGKDGKGKDGKGKPAREFEVFIGGLPFSTTEDVLKKDFEECGEIVAFRMPYNDEGACRGVAFCEYTNKEAVDKALAFDGTDYGGRFLRVRLSGDDSGKGKGKDGKGKDGKGKGNKEFEIFLGGLPFSVTEEALKKDFTECGEIVNFRLPLNDEGNPRGIAFMEFKDQESVDKALKFHETDYGGRTLTVKKSGDGKGDKGKGKDGKGKGKKGKGKAPSESFAKNTGCIVAGSGEKKTFDSDSE